jgi:predicted phage terminase large subunit-like protein
MNLNPKEEEIIKHMIKDRTFRLALVKKSHYWFFYYYFGQKYAKYPTADFQREIFNITENPELKNIVITAFRGSAKSTIITLSYVIWSIVGIKQKKFPIILGRTQLNTQPNLNAIKKELEENDLFRKDFGPFKEEVDTNGTTQSIILPQYNAQISTRSIGQNIRGIKHLQYRPDLIIADDIEDSDSIKSQKNRDELFDWLTGDVIPAGDRDTQLIFIGTPLHNDSILMRLKALFQNGDPKNIYREFPIVDENNIPLWLGKFKTQEDIDNERKKCFSEIMWQREYLLKILDSEDQIIKREHIHYYEELLTGHCRFSATAIDPARSLKSTADYTAIVSGKMFEYEKNRKLYIMPNPINERLTTDQQIQKVKNISKGLNNNESYSRVYVEDVGFQGVITDLLKSEGIPAKPFPVRGWSKEDRLMSVSSLIELGRVVFPKKGAEKLLEQIIGFGKESHDDLVDACTMLIFQAFEDSKKPRPRIQNIFIY